MTDNKIVPAGWRLVDGPALGGDKYWNAVGQAWCPVTVNTFKQAADFVAMIRKVMPPCKYGDPTCPCQDGDMCHYEGPNPFPPPKGSLPEDAPNKAFGTTTAQRATNAAERIWNELLDDDRRDITRIRAIIYLYLAFERRACTAETDRDTGGIK